MEFIYLWAFVTLFPRRMIVRRATSSGFTGQNYSIIIHRDLYGPDVNEEDVNTVSSKSSRTLGQ